MIPRAGDTPADRRSGAVAFPIAAETVRYIKLGEGGGWERECFDSGVCRIGFDSGVPEVLDDCLAGRWDRVAEYWRQRVKSSGTATRYTNEVRKFFDDDGSTLWVSFDSDRLYWGFLEPGSRPMPHPSGEGSTRPVVGGWSSVDRNGRELRRSDLAGTLTKLSMYRGTSCDVDCAPYVLRRINGESPAAVQEAEAALRVLRGATVQLMRLLEPRDFELLVDLVFSSSGWQRQGAVGKTQKTLDLDLVLPTTGDRALVQVKSRTRQAELDEYVRLFGEMDDEARVFFVYHTGDVKTDDDRVTVLGPDAFADLVIDAGLVNWLIRKTQ